MSISDLLIVAPYVGEFGWELMNWQGRVRWELERRRAASVILCSAPDRRVLYRDLLDQPGVRFCPMPSFDWPGRPNDDHRVSADDMPIDADGLQAFVRERVSRVLAQCGVDASGADWLMPAYRSHLWSTSGSEQTFINLRASAGIRYDVLLVPRTRHHAVERNQSDAWWNELTDRLRAAGLRVATYPGSIDEAVPMLSSARLAAGASTGGLHLAGLCRCPHYVWGSGSEQRWTAWRMTNRQRYETLWNPLATPCIYDEIGWQPSIEQVVCGIQKALRRIGRADTGDKSLAFRVKWRVRRGLAQWVEQMSRDSVWPWRVRRFVREHLV